MSKWREFWGAFDNLMKKLPGVISEAVESGDGYASTSVISNGDIVLRGRFKSLRINGYRVNVAEYVMQGKLKP